MAEGESFTFTLTENGSRTDAGSIGYNVEFDRNSPNPSARKFIAHVVYEHKDEFGTILVNTSDGVRAGSVIYGHGSTIREIIINEMLDMRISCASVDRCPALYGNSIRADYTVYLMDPREYIKLEESQTLVTGAQILYIRNQGINMFELIEAIRNGIMGESGSITILHEDGSKFETEWKLHEGPDKEKRIPARYVFDRVHCCQVTHYPRNKTAHFMIELKRQKKRIGRLPTIGFPFGRLIKK